MKKFIAASVMSLTLGLVPLMAQEKKEMPMKEGMPIKGEEMQGGMMKGQAMRRAKKRRRWGR